MRFVETVIPGMWLIEPVRHVDDRGYFYRTFCEQEFALHGLQTEFRQHSISYNRQAGTLRGLHFQLPPHEEIKLVRCTRGTVFDVVVDLRPTSPTKGQWFGVELSADNGISVYIPAGCAHGFQSLVNDTELLYLIDVPHVPGVGNGVAWDDPWLEIKWPLPPTVISDKDRNLPSFGAYLCGSQLRG